MGSEKKKKKKKKKKKNLKIWNVNRHPSEEEEEKKKNNTDVDLTVETNSYFPFQTYWTVPLRNRKMDTKQLFVPEGTIPAF